MYKYKELGIPPFKKESFTTMDTPSNSALAEVITKAVNDAIQAHKTKSSRQGFKTILPANLGTSTVESFTTESNLNDTDKYGDYAGEIGDSSALDTAQGKLDEYESMVEERTRLEDKIREMENPNTDVEIQSTSTIYMTLILTAVGTSMLYYFFKKL
jgi:hypothetical protein